MEWIDVNKELPEYGIRVVLTGKEHIFDEFSGEKIKSFVIIGYRDHTNKNGENYRSPEIKRGLFFLFTVLEVQPIFMGYRSPCYTEDGKLDI